MVNLEQFKFRRLFIIIVFLSILPDKANAYIDPNTGGFFFTTVLPFVYGILAAVVIFWKRITSTIKSIFIRKKEEKS